MLFSKEAKRAFLSFDYHSGHWYKNVLSVMRVVFWCRKYNQK